MNRRSFTKYFGALIASPALPASALSASAPAMVSPNTSMQVWAGFISRVHNRASPKMYQDMLGLSPSEANSVFNALVHDKTLKIGADGAAQITNPFKRNFLDQALTQLQSTYKVQIDVKDPTRSLGQDKSKTPNKDIMRKINSDSEPVNHDEAKQDNDTELHKNPDPDSSNHA